MTDVSTSADSDTDPHSNCETFEAGDIVRDSASVQGKRVIVLEQTAFAANDYFLLETQKTVAQSGGNKREWATDPVVEAVYESDVRRVFGDDWFTGDVLMAYDEARLDDQMTRYRFPSGRLEVIVDQ
ncbi:hypothetical protein [Natronorubrum daqingense]|uniref:Uncharacterized protein n=1 Tax=Natronorubrum daqingense TaxID=588898 RepID=A0A1N7G1B7_9EURY|nr:hypothetical protein [Natronorubrum daqingense]APX98626.1 hypothetical protein BB347_18205 [Natronorubrum daqingense]SIS06345.1 hypothetical protein SAMN05421809_3657 [Natronorubrum daqingense]